MNVLKHMEAVFVFALGTAAAVAVTVEASAPAIAKPQQQVLALDANAAAMPVVHVVAKRMTPAEKRASLAAERTAGRVTGRA